MEKKFKSGDVVQVLSGSDKMVVIEYRMTYVGAVFNAVYKTNTYPSEVETSEVLCEFFYKGARKRQYFNEDSLELVPDKFLKQSEDELYSEFNFDKDQDVDATFDTQTQIRIYDALEIAIQNLRRLPQSEKVEEIISETIKLKDNFQNLPKVQVVRWLAKIMAKAKKYGMNIFKAIYEVGYKEIIKVGLHQTLDEIPKIIHTIIS